MTAVRILKAHAYGNDFLFAEAEEFPGDAAQLARTACHRHHGIGADGLILFTLRERGSTMRLWNDRRNLPSSSMNQGFSQNWCLASARCVAFGSRSRGEIGTSFSTIRVTFTSPMDQLRLATARFSPGRSVSVQLPESKPRYAPSACFAPILLFDSAMSETASSW